MSLAIVSLPDQLPSDPTVLSEQKMQSSALLTAHPPCLSNVMHLVLLMLFPRKKNSQCNPIVPEVRLRSEPAPAQIKPKHELAMFKLRVPVEKIEPCKTLGITVLNKISG